MSHHFTKYVPNAPDGNSLLLDPVLHLLVPLAVPLHDLLQVGEESLDQLSVHHRVVVAHGLEEGPVEHALHHLQVAQVAPLSVEEF